MDIPRLPLKSLRYPLVLSTLLLAQAGWAVGPPDHAQNKIGNAVREAILADGGANVMIALSHPGAKKDGKGLNLAALRSDIHAQQSSVMAAVGNGFNVKENFSAVPAMAGRITSAAALDALARNPHVLKVDLELSGVGHLEQSVPLVGADLRQLVGNTGSGVVVAVLDSGVDTDHTDLADHLMAEACFADDDGAIDGAGRCPNGSDRQTGPGAAEDDAGHGTHVTGIITSGGVVGPIGVAPNAGFVAVRISYGPSFAGAFASFSEVVAGLNYIINNPGLGVQVINMSVGTGAEFTGDCDNASASAMAGAAAINTLRAAGVTTFASAGNNTNLSQMPLPACLSNVISVGASDNNDVVANFSNASATTDIFAPGVSVNSSAIGDGTTIASGTSMASPTAAGCAALLIESGDATTPNAIETWLESSAILINVPGNGMSYPRIDCDPLVNVPPICDANGPYVAECGVALNLDGSGSIDPNGDPLAYEWSGPIVGGSTTGETPSVIFPTPTGVKNINLEVDDGEDTDQCSAPVIVEDTLMPVVTPPADVVEECTGPAGTAVLIGMATAMDACDPNPAISDDAPALFPLGDTTVNWQATDNDGNQGGAQQTVTVEDTTPPVISCNSPATISPDQAPISFTASAEDQCQGPVPAEITAYNCYKMTKKGKLVSKLKSCEVSFNGDQVTIENSGGVADMISWEVSTVDAQGNQASQTCQLAVVNPND
jgi:subtilisin family serine protease